MKHRLISKIHHTGKDSFEGMGRIEAVRDQKGSPSRRRVRSSTGGRGLPTE